MFFLPLFLLCCLWHVIHAQMWPRQHFLLCRWENATVPICYVIWWGPCTLKLHTSMLSDDYQVCPIGCAMLLFWQFKNGLSLLNREGRIIPPTNCKLGDCTTMKVKAHFLPLPAYKFIFFDKKFVLPVCWAWDSNRSSNREHDVDNKNVELCVRN